MQDAPRTGVPMVCLLAGCYGLAVGPARDFHKSGFAGQHGDSEFGKVKRPDRDTLEEWSTLPPWEGGWSPYASVEVVWQARRKVERQ